MNTLLATLFILYVLCMGVTPLSAMTVKEYRASRSDGEYPTLVKAYIRGVGEGIEYANTEAAGKNMAFYCEPGKLALGADNYLNILDQSIKGNSDKMSKEALDEMPVELLLLKGLEGTFPCK